MPLLCQHLLLQESTLFLALAGQHQIWRVDLSDGTAQAFSGDGSERNANATTGAKTSWAQPSGLSLGTSGEEVWVADSESSCVRSMAVVSGAGRVSHPFCRRGRCWPQQAHMESSKMSKSLLTQNVPTMLLEAL